MTTHEEIRALLDRLEEAANSVLMERQVEIRCLINALLARLHIAIIGPPGAGKSFMVDTVVGLIGGFGPEDYFSSQLGRRSEPDDLFGSYTLESVRAGRYRRDTTRKLPNARVAVIKEFWRAPDAATDDLKSILQERIFYNGGDAQPCELCTLVIDSNEMPESGHALADRFTFWLITRPIMGVGNVKTMLAGATERLHAVGTTNRPVVSPVIAWSAILQAQEAVAAVKIPEGIHTALANLRSRLATAGIFPSDRRLVSCLSVMQAQAYRAGRLEVVSEDMDLLAHVLWTKPAELPKVQRLVYTVSNPYDLRALDLGDDVAKCAREYEALLLVTDVPTRKRGLMSLHVRISGDRRTGRLGIGNHLKTLKEEAEANGKPVTLYPALAAQTKALGMQLLETLKALE